MKLQTDLTNIKKNLVLAASIVGGLGLFAGAIVSTSSVAQLSYESAQLKRQQAALLQERQVLQEQLATTQSLETTVSYAMSNDFTISTTLVGSLETVSSLAQAR